MKDIKVSQVLTLLNEGKSREEIADHFEISMADCKRLFQHPELKGKKAKKQPAFNLIDDVNGEEISQPEVEEEVINEEVTDEQEEVLDTEEVASEWDN
jgi:transposase